MVVHDQTHRCMMMILLDVFLRVKS
jgi:hypothetical protein